MSLFNKKQIQKQPDYTNFEKEFGFLNLILSRKKGITKEFLIGVYANQKSEKDYLTDEEINPIVEDIVIEVLSQIGDTYKNFLIDKYFGDEEALIKYITEDVYVDLISDSINRNTIKIKNGMYGKLVSNLGKLNKN